MDSSESPTHGYQEGSAWNGHFGCTCYHPLFLFNQFGDLERCLLRPGNVHSAEDWRPVLEPVIARYRERGVVLYFRADAAFAKPGIYASDRSAPTATSAASGMSIRSNDRGQPDGRGAAMLDRELLKRDPSAGRKLENTVLRNHEACPSPRSDPCSLAWRARRGQSRPSEAGIRGIPVERRGDAAGLVAGAAFALLGLILTACNSIGPGTVPRDRVDYANALSDSWKDQMLLNIVRLRYSDAPTFLDVSSVISAYTMQEALQASATANVGVPNNTTITPNGAASVTAQGGYNDRPTISYTPLSGAKFAKSLLQPIPPDAIFSLIAAGYPAEIVIPVTVSALNGVYNRTSRGGIRRPSDPEFYPLVEAMGRIQASRSFSLRIEKQNGQPVAIGTFSSRLAPELQRDIEFVKKTLNLRSKNGEVILNYGALQRSPSELAVVSRSMIEIMQELSADMEVPAEDVSERRTYATAEPPANPSPYDQPRVVIHSGATPPGDAFTAVRYRATWYWISDHDLSSKGSLTFLLLFFSLAETGVVPEVPVLTLPVQ